MDSVNRKQSYFQRYVLALLLLVTFIGVLSVPAQSSDNGISHCKIGSQAARTGFWTWAPGSNVRVYILQDDFKADELPSLIKPLQLWDAVWESTGSRVRVSYAGTASSTQECENCLTMVRSKIYNGKTKHGGEIKAHGIKGSRIIKWATITIDPKLNNANSLTHAVAHEVGHSFGLLDCYDCKGGSTVMLQFAKIVLSDISGPTKCDIAQVRKAYQELSLRARPAAVAGVPEDEGEAPEVDDTPLVVPHP